MSWAVTFLCFPAFILVRLLLFSEFACEVGMSFSLGRDVRLSPYQRVLEIRSGQSGDGRCAIASAACKFLYPK
ncbi:hypothetical protein HOY80DRAFT_969677 [Tuber brumale]|nr:hypothetical protein HOY80DRAFT_969677 [Tuber brumale]